MMTRRVLTSKILVAAGLMAALFSSARASDLAKPEFIIVTQAGIGNAFNTGVVRAAVATAHSAVSQHGSGNRADIVQSGKSHSMTVQQDGSLNTVAATQTGFSNSLDLTQQGNNNHAVFNQTGGTRASLSQIGDLHRAEINQSFTSPDIVIHQSGVATVVRTTQY